MMGNGTFLPSFGSGSFPMFFCVDWFGADMYETGVWVNNRAGSEPKQISVSRVFNNFYLEAGGFARFRIVKDQSVTARVGLSFKSSTQACFSAEKDASDPLGQFESLQ